MLNSDTAIEHLTDRFLDRSLPKSEWTHTAHFAVALSLLNRLGSEAYSRMPEGIREYNVATGVANTDTEGYHETITLASLRAANHVMNLHPNASITEHLNIMMDREFARSDWLFDYWSKPVLFSVEARRSWVAPDLAPLPF
ncbi:MAG: hypothetical protein AAFV59_05225 [Pseudomonadota bacterium]